MADNYYNKKNTVEEYIKLTKNVNGLNLIEKFTPYLPSNANILEIGSGPGSDWNILHQNFNITGSDNSKEFLSYLYSKYPKGKFIELDAITLNIDEKFNGIYANKVLQHLNHKELIKSIKRQFDILHPNGIICVSFWEGEGSEIFKGLYVQYHTKKSIKKYFEKYFDILILESYAEFEKDDSLLLIGKKKTQN